jgi:DNA mismatch repair protein MutS2
MKLYPQNAGVSIEFEKVKSLLTNYCNTEWAKNTAQNLRIHTRKEFIETDLNRTNEYLLILIGSGYFPNHFYDNVSKEIKLLQIAGSTLNIEQIIQIKKLTENFKNIFRWFDDDKKMAYPFLYSVSQDVVFQKDILQIIDSVIDESGEIKDDASENLFSIRTNLYKKRQELRKTFEKVLQKLNKAGYLADIDESFSNGRRLVAVFSEYKRIVKGIYYGESDTKKTSFIEPEETIELNNEVQYLENQESKEIQKILKQTTVALAIFANDIEQYFKVANAYDFIAAKAMLAKEMQAVLPNYSDKAIIDLKDAYHPLLVLYNKRVGKETIPITVSLNEKNRILVISGPNAGGKTVTLKTVGLLQMMLQSGLLIPVHPNSEMGIFKLLFIHIGDTQSLEFELSTYSSHLLHMKYFIENANGKTLFFIDELGSGSDPNLGGAFAEVVLEELLKKHSLGIVTTHYLNLKIMASKTAGILNAAMAFDEKNLLPLYKLIIGKPGSSYTFSIAERIGLPQHLINRAKKMVDDGHFKLDKLLNKAEQESQKVYSESKKLENLIDKNKKLQIELEKAISREKHNQQIELLINQNKISEEKILYLKETERKLKQIINDWRKAEDKNEAIKQIQNVLFKKKEGIAKNKMLKKLENKFEESTEEIKINSTVKLRKNYQTGVVVDLRGKRAVVQIGAVPMSFNINDLVVIKEKTN